MANHLIIGLGGTGGKIIRELRKRIVEECGSLDPGNGTNIEYIYVDSSAQDLDDRSQWKVLGKSVHLGNAQKVSINGINRTVLNDLAHFPGLASFISADDKRMIDQRMEALIDAGIGGQRRRLGRILFANNISGGGVGGNFENILNAAVNKLQASGNQGCTFHILAGLAGGTGSGAILDVIAQIRKTYHYDLTVPADDDRRHKIRLFTYIPEKNIVHQNRNQGYYQANGYAALLELNALSVNKYAPTDVSGQIDYTTGKVQRLLANDEAFQVAYLFTNENIEGKSKDLDVTLPQAVADFIYQTVIVASAPGISGSMNRLVNAENNGAAPEVDSTNVPSRSRRFMSFGISKVIFPETEIKEFVSYSFAKEALKQLLYNNWTPGIGYNNHSEDANAAAIRINVDEHAFKQKYRLTDSCLAAEEGIIADNESRLWTSYETTMKTSFKRLADRVKTENGINNVASWMGEFDDKVDVYIKSQFRRVGVDKFFAVQNENIPSYVSTIRKKLEDDLFSEWINGDNNTRSLTQMQLFVRVLREELANQITSCREKRERFNAKLNDFKKELAEAKHDWGHVRMGHVNPYPFAEYVEISRDLYETNIRIMSMDYAISLLNRLCEDLNSLYNQIDGLVRKLSGLLDFAQEQINSRCVIGQNEDARQSIKKIYSPEIVHEIVGGYQKDRNVQDDNVSAVRSAINDSIAIGGDRTFARIERDLNFDTLLDTVFSVQAIKALNKTAIADPSKRMVDVNIMDKIQSKYSSSLERERFISDIVKLASAHLPFDNQQLGVVGTVQPLNMVEIALPSAVTDDQKTFCDQFKREVSNTVANPEFSENNKMNQLIVVSAYSSFPLRASSNVAILKNEYNRLTGDNNPDRMFNRMVLHTETFDKELPPLYELTRGEVRAMAIKPIMKAFAMNIIQRQVNPVTQQYAYSMNIPDSVLGDNWIPLGVNFMECWDKLSESLSNVRALISQVNNTMANQYVPNDQRKLLRTSLSNFYQEKIVRDTFGGDQTGETCQKLRQHILSIINELNIQD